MPLRADRRREPSPRHDPPRPNVAWFTLRRGFPKGRKQMHVIANDGIPRGEELTVSEDRGTGKGGQNATRVVRAVYLGYREAQHLCTSGTLPSEPVFPERRIGQRSSQNCGPHKDRLLGTDSSTSVSRQHAHDPVVGGQLVMNWHLEVRLWTKTSPISMVRRNGFSCVKILGPQGSSAGSITPRDSDFGIHDFAFTSEFRKCAKELCCIRAAARQRFGQVRTLKSRARLALRHLCLRTLRVRCSGANQGGGSRSAPEGAESEGKEAQRLCADPAPRSPARPGGEEPESVLLLPTPERALRLFGGSGRRCACRRCADGDAQGERRIGSLLSRLHAVLAVRPPTDESTGEAHACLRELDALLPFSMVVKAGGARRDCAGQHVSTGTATLSF